MYNQDIKNLRKTMRTSWNKEDIFVSDQDEKKPAPPMMATPTGAPMTVLPDPSETVIEDLSLYEMLERRRSRRVFLAEPITLQELSFLLWCSQGYQRPRPGQKSYAALRTVPSAGCRHPFDTYLAVMKVEGLEPGIYRFLPKEHAVELVKAYDAKELCGKVSEACCDQIFCGRAAVTFFWVADMYRCEWRYPNSAHKVVLLDAGHVCQNLYLACEVLGLGTCAIGAYEQEAVDELLSGDLSSAATNTFAVDGEDRFCVYAAPVGHPRG